jgi:hypothetical protein
MAAQLRTRGSLQAPGEGPQGVHGTRDGVFETERVPADSYLSPRALVQMVQFWWE